MNRIKRSLALVLSVVLLCALLPAAPLAAHAVTVSDISLQTETLVNVETPGETVYFRFVPEETAVYRFFSVIDADTWAALYGADMKEIINNDDNGVDNNFQIDQELTAGETYYYAARFLGGDKTGSFPVWLVKPTGEGITAAAKNGKANFLISAGDSVTLEVEASSDMGAVTYQWYIYGDPKRLIEGETGNSLTLENETGNGAYLCLIRDAFGSIAQVRFNIYCFTYTDIAPDTETAVNVEEGGKIIFFRFIPLETATYRFFSVVDADTWAALYDADMNELTHNDDNGVDNNFQIDQKLTAGETYYFAARFLDGAKTGSFPVWLVRPTGKGITAAAKDDKANFIVSAGDSVTLEAEASSDMGDVSYKWYHGGTITPIEGATGKTFTVENVTGKAVYDCRIRDAFGSIAQVRFSIYCFSYTDILLNTETAVNVDEGGKITYFRFIPPETAVYSFISLTGADTYAELYDANMNMLAGNDDNGVDRNFQIDQKLTAGETYYFAARFLDGAKTGSFPVLLILPSENGFSAERITPELTFAAVGGTPTLEVTAVCDNGVLHYRWRDAGSRDFIENADKSAFTVPALQKGITYQCFVADDYGNNAIIDFEIVNTDAVSYEWKADYSNCTAVYADSNPAIVETAVPTADTAAPTCTEPGKTTYRAEFKNPRFTAQETVKEESPLGHAYGEPVYVWNEDLSECTAMVICANDESHVLSETAKTHYEVTLKPTCTEPGAGVYTAAFNNKRFYGQVKEVEIPATGHAYGEPVYVWSEDLSECTASVTCANDETHVISETAKSEAEIKPAACTEPGLAVYTAGFVNKRFWGQRKEVEIPAAGHTPGEPVRENETDTAYDEVVYCTVCGDEISRNTVSLVSALPGDADGDGQITASDARLALRRAVDLETFAEGSKEFIACDIDKDGSVTAGDARIILRIAVDLESVEDYR